MTPAELLALLGGAWSRLVLYPGGLFALAVVWVWFRREEERGRRSAGGAPGTSEAHQLSAIGYRLSAIGYLPAVAPLLAIALLPLPGAAALGRPVDVVVLLALLELPRLAAAAAELRAGGEARARGVRRLAAALNGYPPLILAALLFAQGAGSLDVATFAQAAPADAGPVALALRWLGALGIILALPAALEAGAFAAGEDTTTKIQRHAGAQRSWPARLRAFAPPWQAIRALGYVLLAALPLAAPLTAGGMSEWSVFATPLAPLLVAALVWGFARATAGRPALPWARAYLWLSAALILAHALAAAEALRARLA